MPTKLLEMLTYRRPEGSPTQAAFCRKYLDPHMTVDPHGNYIRIIGDSEIAFMAHHDTVHKKDGIQRVIYDEYFDEAFIDDKDSSCLGADCTTGVWLILEMIEANVPGIYVVHAGEEIGCVGSGALVKSKPDWLDKINYAISFDRKDVCSVITHQMGMCTASDEFAKSLAKVLKMPDLKPDPNGSYTDSNEYMHIVPECTNLSVGYYAQHTEKETQDIQFARDLRDALIAADWSGLVAARDPAEHAYDWGPYGGRSLTTDDDLYDYVYRNPDLVTSYLSDFGVTVEDIQTHSYLSGWPEEGDAA